MATSWRVLFAALGAFALGTACWAAWGLAAPGDYFANGSLWVFPTLFVAVAVGAWAGFRAVAGWVRGLIAAATVGASCFHVFVPDGWWAKSPPRPRREQAGLSSPLAGREQMLLSAQEPQLRRTFPGYCAAFSPDGKILAFAGGEKGIRLWDLSTGQELRTLTGEDRIGVAHALAFHPDGKTLASGRAGIRLMLWDISSGKGIIVSKEPRQSQLERLAFSSDGKTLAAGGMCNPDIRLCDVATGNQTATLAGHSRYGIRALSFSPDGKTLASMGCMDGLKLWNVAKGTNTTTLEIVDDEVDAAAFSPDGKIVATASAASTANAEVDLKLWEVATGKELAKLKIDKNVSVRSLVYSSDGKMLAAGGDDGAIKLWDVATGKELAILRGQTEPVSSLIYSPDGSMLAAGSDDGTLKLWDMPKVK